MLNSEPRFYNLKFLLDKKNFCVNIVISDAIVFEKKTLKKHVPMYFYV